MKKKLLRTAAVLLVTLVTAWPAAQYAAAQRGRASGRSTKVQTAIPEDKRPWAGIPWVIAIVLTVGTVVVGLKNAKRTHLD